MNNLLKYIMLVITINLLAIIFLTNEVLDSNNLAIEQECYILAKEVADGVYTADEAAGMPYGQICGYTK